MYICHILQILILIRAISLSKKLVRLSKESLSAFEKYDSIIRRFCFMVAKAVWEKSFFSFPDEI